MANCRCGAEIRWVETSNGRKMPIDAKPRPDGNIRIIGGEAVVLSGDSLTFAATENADLFVSHFMTCPDAKSFRRA